MCVASESVVSMLWKFCCSEEGDDGVFQAKFIEKLG
jgi:hypothetical protein